MKSMTESRSEVHDAPREIGSTERLKALEELDRILSSRHFRSADRSKQFLRYVVLSKLDGHTDRLKERTIGTEVFQRPLGYATGDDPVVRVQAGEVRRRLEQYYQELPQPSPLRIELPVGSYSPVFHWESDSAVAEGHTQTSPARRTLWHRLRAKPISYAAAAILASLGIGVLIHSRLAAGRTSGTIEQFWSPAIASRQPILICIANASDKPPADVPGVSLQTQSGASGAGPEAIEASLPVGQNQNPAADGSPVSPEIVPAADASVAVALSGLFGRLNRPAQLRIGEAATYEDLRNFPAAVIGGFNNRWTMQLVSNLHFAFIRVKGQYMIREEVAGGRVWTTRFGPGGETVEDFAIVARLVDSKTGQFTVTVAGIGPRGTQAAGEFVSSPRDLEDGLAHAPAAWQNRNLEVLLQTTVIDSVAGPPHVIGIYTW